MDDVCATSPPTRRDLLQHTLPARAWWWVSRRGVYGEDVSRQEDDSARIRRTVGDTRSTRREGVVTRRDGRLSRPNLRVHARSDRGAARYTRSVSPMATLGQHIRFLAKRHLQDRRRSVLAISFLQPNHARLTEIQMHVSEREFRQDT